MTQALFDTRPRIGGASIPEQSLGARQDVLKATVEAAVSVVFGVDVARLQGVSRGQAHVAQARQVAMYLAHCAFGLSHTEVGRIFDRDRTTVAHACHLVEDRRDDASFDRTLANLEEIVARLAAISGLPREV